MTNRMRFCRELPAFTAHSGLTAEALVCLQPVGRGEGHYSETKITAEAEAAYLTVILSRESMQGLNSPAFQKSRTEEAGRDVAENATPENCRAAVETFFWTDSKENRETHVGI